MRLSGVRVFLPGVCRVLRSFPLLLFLLVIYLVFFLMRYDTTVLSSAQQMGEIRLVQPFVFTMSLRVVCYFRSFTANECAFLYPICHLLDTQQQSLLKLMHSSNRM